MSGTDSPGFGSHVPATPPTTPGEVDLKDFGLFDVVRKDTQVAGVDLAAGSHVVVMFTSANWDASIFDDSDAFCPAREGVSNHLALGRGIQSGRVVS